VKFLWWAIAVGALGAVLWVASMALGIGTGVAGTSSGTGYWNGASSGSSSGSGTSGNGDTDDGGWVSSVWDAGPGYVVSVWEELWSATTGGQV
jgi:hypothetical protein